MKKTARWELTPPARVKPAPIIGIDRLTRVRHFHASGWGGAVVDRGRKRKSSLHMRGDWD